MIFWNSITTMWYNGNSRNSDYQFVQSKIDSLFTRFREYSLHISRFTLPIGRKRKLFKTKNSVYSALASSCGNACIWRHTDSRKFFIKWFIWSPWGYKVHLQKKKQRNIYIHTYKYIHLYAIHNLKLNINLF